MSGEPDNHSIDHCAPLNKIIRRLNLQLVRQSHPAFPMTNAVLRYQKSRHDSETGNGSFSIEMEKVLLRHLVVFFSRAVVFVRWPILLLAIFTLAMKKVHYSKYDRHGPDIGDSNRAAVVERMLPILPALWLRF